MAYIQVNVMSECLMRTVNINVILPVDKFGVPGAQTQADRPFKTLYLLHGIFGSQVDWVNGTRLQRWAEEKNLAVVMPAGENLFYVDQEATHNLYGEFVGRELVDLTRRMFPLSRRREDTFIGGLSMGGYGALRNGLKYSDTFGGIAALSAADFSDPGRWQEDAKEFFRTRRYVEAVLGSREAFPGSDRDVRALAARPYDGEKAKVYIACGLDDPLLPANRGLRDCLRQNGFPVTYEEAPGAHEWDFWDSQIKKVIDWLPLEGVAGLNSGNVGLE